MGRVFSLTEIDKVEVPELSSFSEVAQRLRDVLGASESIVGAIICGSVCLGNYNRRSDVDCLVVYKSAQVVEALTVMRDLKVFADDLYVPLEFIPLNGQTASQVLSNDGFSFIAHLSRVVGRGGLIKKNPLPSLSFNSELLERDTYSYLCHKAKYIQGGIISLGVMNTTDRCKFFQKTLEAPLHIARKIVFWKNPNLPDDQKSVIMGQYPAMVRDEKELLLFEKITTLDHRYSQAVTDHLQFLKVREYEDILNVIAESAYDTLEFIQRVKINYF